VSIIRLPVAQLTSLRMTLAQAYRGFERITMLKVTYNLTIGSWSINSSNDPRTEFVKLELGLSMASPADTCCITVFAPPAPQPSLLEQTVGTAAGALGLGSGSEPAFSVQVRGIEIKPGDEMTLELTSGDQTGKIMTADVLCVRSSLGRTKFVGATGMQKLTNTRLNQVYENQSLQQIANDLAGQAGVSTGEIETGSTYRCFVVQEAKSVLSHLRDLAMRDGLDVYFDTDNKLTMQKFDKSSADHTFYYGIDILDLQLINRQPASDHIRVYGESPATNQGADTWHWLVKDLSPFQSDVGEGNHLLTIKDGAVRTKDAADQLAIAKFGAIKDQSTWGRLKLLGNPKVRVADAIEIKNAPQPQLNGLFKVTSLRHVLNKWDGYLTFVGFTGQGGAAAAGGLLAALGGLAGGLGL
jgi:hypothetical protein